MYNIRIIKFKKFSDKYGSLVPIEAEKDIPFAVRRIYYIFDVPAKTRRGFHSHKCLHQVLVCLKGSVKILVKTSVEEQIVNLSDASEGLYIGPMIWREMYDFSEGSVLLVMASEHYDEGDYERNYDKYIKTVNALF